MQLELTLGKTSGYQSGSFTFLSRERFKINDESDFMRSVIKFIGDNSDTIMSALGDKELYGKIMNLQSLSVADFRTLRLMLSDKYGLEISYWSVADEETNADSIAEGTIEYNVIDEMAAYNGVSRYAVKVSVPEDNVRFSYLYKKIISAFDLFNSEMFSDYDNPLQRENTGIIANLDPEETLTGEVNPVVTHEAAQVFKYLGLKYVAYTA